MANLIAYYTREGENYWDGGIRSIEKGNTERVAEFIQDAIGGDLFRINTARPYPESYMDCIDVAKRELQQDARPALAATLEDVSAYDTVFLGYPNWWGTCPMCVFTFLDGLDLSGMRIVPFCTSEGSGLGGSVKHLKKLYPASIVEEGLAVTGHLAEQSANQVASWAKRMA